MTAARAVEPQVDERLDYTPSRVDSYIRDWDALRSAAEGTRSPSLISTGAQPGKGGVRDRYRAADIMADIVGAHRQLAHGSLEFRVIARRIMYSGQSLDRIARILAANYSDVLTANRHAVRMIAVVLGWREPEEPEAK